MWNSSKEDLNGIILLSIINILVVYVMAWIRSFPNNWMYLHTYSQTVGIFGKVMKTLRVVALLEEVYHRGELWVCISNSTSCSLCSLCMNANVISQVPVAILSLTISTPSHSWSALSLWNHEPKLILKLFWLGYFIVVTQQ